MIVYTVHTSTKEGRGEVVCQDDCVNCPYPHKGGERGGGMSR